MNPKLTYFVVLQSPLCSDTDSYDWYQRYGNFRHLLTPKSLKANSSSVAFPHQGCRVLVLGCGNSTLGEDMLRDGWDGEIVNVDFSAVVIEQMKKKYNDDFYGKMNGRKKMEWLCADVTKTLPFPDGYFDLIICKGTFDAVLCSSGSASNAIFMVQESVRLLANGYGVFFLVTYGTPDSRIVFLEHENDLSHYWQEVSTHTVARSKMDGAK
jgi:SAM-dependent methyltransferase